jgi:pimeloyl-ACP methyl ester carboxylesterase
VSEQDFYIARGSSATLPLSAGDAFTPTSPAQLALPGVVIFVHGVNSMGEWFSETEQGLCEGLNQRLARTDDKMLCSGVPGGCLQANEYGEEVDVDGNLCDADAGNFFQSAGNYSPVIRFRWGYRCAPGDQGLEKAKDDPSSELAQFESEIMLNKDDAWGGGPFQNGTSCLGDLWGPGLTDRMFWFFNIQQFNGTARSVFKCPTRQYMVHAAQRLADLIADIRATQPSCPINVVCHSQGNMIGLAAAMLAEGPDDVADNYVLCNPPYSLEHIKTYSLSDSGLRSIKEMSNPLSTRSEDKRIATFDHFLQRVQTRGATTTGLQPLDKINERIENTQNGSTHFKLAETVNYESGNDRDNRGNVFLYVNPHDQVIGVSTIQGIGWKGVTQKQIGQFTSTNFYQRVWAQGIKVGDPARQQYHYWDDHWNAEEAKRDNNAFWYPLSPRVKYVVANGRYDQSVIQSAAAWLVQGIVALAGTVIDALKIVGIDLALNLRVNDPPPKDHVLPINAPEVPKVDGDYVTPRSVNAGKTVTRGNEEIVSREFDEGVDESTESVLSQQDDSAARRDARMENNAVTRMQASQKEKARWYNLGAKRRADAQYQAWFTAEPQNATDHSSILKNPEHARRVLAYDLAVGVAQIPPEKWQKWREKAHWRFDPQDTYYTQGVVGGGGNIRERTSTQNSGQTVQNAYPMSSMPDTIVDTPLPRDAIVIQEQHQAGIPA